MKIKTSTILASTLLALVMLIVVLELVAKGFVQPAYSLQKSFDHQTISTTSITHPVYLTATLLLERLPNGDLTELVPPLPQWQFRYMSILPENDAWRMWLNNQYHSPGQRVAVEQYLESEDGIIWSNRTDTNLIDSIPDYHVLYGIRSVIKSGDIYQGWESTYYNVVDGMWVRRIRYITSTNGLDWQVVTPEIIASAGAFTVNRDENIYEMWAPPYGDSGYTGSQSLRYRISAFPDGDWGDWETGGSLVLVDGDEVIRETRVRKLTDGTYEMFYRPVMSSTQVNLAVSIDGFNFTTTITNLVDLASILPDFSLYRDMFVLDVNGEDWFYFTYIDIENQGRIAVAKPTYLLEGLTAVNDSPTTLGQVTQLTSTVTSGSNISYTWDLGDGTIMTGSTVAHIYPAVGVYTAVITAVNSISSQTVATIVHITPEQMYLPLVTSPLLPTLPLFIGPSVPARTVIDQGGIFYRGEVEFPASLPSGGTFYLSSSPMELQEIAVDDELLLQIDSTTIYTHRFSAAGIPPVWEVLEIPPVVLTRLTGQTVTVIYKDVYGVLIHASDIWLVWEP
ncbi:MAG: PKD domain-containing protein [Ardenticatenaceae bacterium]|nr:PKD domain-containing protein [Ardenticatenaceae bacterium]